MKLKTHKSAAKRVKIKKIVCQEKKLTVGIYCEKRILSVYAIYRKQV